VPVPRLTGLVAATAIVLAVAGCGGSGHHSSTSAHASTTPADSSTSAHASTTPAHSTTPADSPAYPATFVARSTNPKAPGIAVFSTHSGQPLRRLTNNPRDIDPLLTHDRHWVYFVRVPQDPCPVQLERVPSTGGSAQRLAPAGYPGGPVAISQDGRMLAYISTGSSCRLAASADTLVLVNLATGQVHRISAVTFGMAWSPDDRTLAFVGPNPSTGRSVIKLVSAPMRADPAQIRAAPSIPCPTADPCAATSPTFDAQGALFYTAMISHEPGDRCWLSQCRDWSYALASRHGGRTQLLSTQRPHGDAVLGAGVVNAAGSAMIYRLPFHGGYRIWRWSAAGHAPVPAPGAGAGQPVWR
jgi:hypothetical protein